VLDSEWLNRPYVSRISCASAAALRPLRGSYNAERPFPEQVKPFNFLLCVHVAPFSHPAGYPPERFQLIAPFEPDPRRWLEMSWTDHYSGDTFHIHTDGPPSPDSIKVKTNRDVLDRYRSHPEPKSLDQDGKPCARQTVGLLQRRPVHTTEIVYIGKESNRLEDATAGLVHDLGEILASYRDPQLDPYRILVLPALRTFGTAQVAEATGLDRRTVQRLLRERQYPHRRHRASLIAVAAGLAASTIRARGGDPPRAPLAVLRSYLEQQQPDRACPVCGAVVTGARALYCSSTCKKHAYRQRLQARVRAMTGVKAASTSGRV
jgi:predicted nucleic acid-binding Zn ribbon protein